jgi:hypothetical protein
MNPSQVLSVQNADFEEYNELELMATVMDESAFKSHKSFLDRKELI